MGKLIVVENDKVKGVDKHKVSGSQPTYNGIGEYEYNGKMVGQLSDFVRINSQPLAVKSSKSSLDPGEAATGGHFGPNGKNFAPELPEPKPSTLTIIDVPIGTGVPSATSGSTFTRINGIAILLHGDKIDTCDGSGATMNSSITAENQDFVSCSE